MGEEHMAYPKPPLGAKPRWINDWARLEELASAIVRYASEDGKHKYELIKPWAEEIVDICDNAEYGKHDH